MKRILTLAIAAMLVVAFAIPTFAAPKVELVSGNVSTHVDYASGTALGIQDGPVVGNLKFKFSADNFVFNVKLSNAMVVGNYDFSLALPYMTLSGLYDSFTAGFGYHGGHEVRLASDEKFAEMAGFNWAVYTNDDNATGAFDSAHAQISIPVGENFTSALNWAYEGSHLGYLDLSYTISEGLSVATQIAKNIDSATNDFFGAVTVNFPVIEGLTGTFFAQYGMTGFVPDTDFLNYGGYFLGYDANTFESYVDFNYANENAHAQLFVDYNSDSTFAARGDIFAMAEYASNSKNSWWSSNTRRALYADTTDSFGRGWNSQYKWVRNNSGNNFAVRAQGDLFGDNAWDARVYGMFAPEVVPVVLTARGTYASTGNWDVRNWVGVRLTEDIHFAIYDRYIYDAATTTGTFDVDAALVYNRDSVTASITGTTLTHVWGANLFVGIDF